MKVINIVRDAVYESKEEKRLLQIMEHKWVDPNPDFVEGIFKVN